MRVIIVGAGQVGFYLSERLSNEGHQVVLIDSDEKKLQKIERDLNILTVQGNGAYARILAEAGIAKTDLFIAVTDSDEVNIIACILSNNYDVKTRVARVRNEEFLEDSTVLDEQGLNIDLLISPDWAMTQEIVGLCHFSEAFDMAEFANGRLMLLGYHIQQDNPIINTQLHEFQKLRGGHHFTMTAIIRDGETIIPRGDETVQAEDRIYIMVRRHDIPLVEELFHITSKKPEKVFIIGGDNIGYLVARTLEDLNFDVTLVEIDKDRCEFLSENLSRTLVLNCDGLEAADLLEEGIDKADLIISLTGSDTTNILSSLLAKHHGTQKCITKITRPDFVPLLGNLGIDVALSSRQVAASMILRFVRRGAIGIVATLLESNAEAMEIRVPHIDTLDAVQLKELEFPKGSIIGAIIRGRQIMIPSGETLIKSGDSLVVFFVQAAADKLENFFNMEK